MEACPPIVNAWYGCKVEGEWRLTPTVNYYLQYYGEEAWVGREVEKHRGKVSQDCGYNF